MTDHESLFAFQFVYDNGERVYRIVAASVREAEAKAADRHGDDWEKWVKVDLDEDDDPNEGLAGDFAHDIIRESRLG